MKKTVILVLIRIIILTALCLCCFAFFHHVKPRLNNTHAVADTQPTALLSDVTPSPAPQQITTAATDPEDTRTEWQKKFAERFSEERLSDELSYKSPDISVTVDVIDKEYKGSVSRFYVADIYIARIENLAAYACGNQFKTYSADTAENVAAEAGAILSINGDFCTAQGGKNFFVRNGEVFNSVPASCDICVLYYDGTMKTYPGGKYSTDVILKKEPYQVWTFGPELLDGDGKAREQFNTSSAIYGINPRSAIGYYEPGHYCFVMVEGRLDRSVGVNMAQLASFFEELGCAQAYNLDGGASSTLVMNGVLLNAQPKERLIGDVVIIKEVD